MKISRYLTNPRLNKRTFIPFEHLPTEHSMYGRGGAGGCELKAINAYYDSSDFKLAAAVFGPEVNTIHDSTYYLPDADGEYQSYTTNKTAWIGGRYVDEDNVYATDSSGNLLDPPPEMVSQPAAQNINNYSYNIRAWWGGTATLTAITKGLNPSYLGNRITDDDTGAGEYAYNSITKTAPLARGAGKFYLLKQSSATANAQLYLQFYNGGTTENHRVSINLETGAYLIDRDDTSTLTVSVTLVANTVIGDYYKIVICAVPSDTSNANYIIGISPTYYTVNTTTADASLTGYVDELNIELYEDMTITQVNNLGAIFTNGAAVSTDALNPEFSSSLLDNNSFAMAGNIRIDGADAVSGNFLSVVGSNLVLTDTSSNTVSVAYSTGEMNKVGVVFNKSEGKMKLYVNDNSAEGPYSGEFHDGILDWFRDSLFPGGLYGYKIWNRCTWDEQNENVTNWLSDLNKAFDDGFDDGFS